MNLNPEQLKSLSALLEPAFRTPQQREQAIEKVALSDGKALLDVAAVEHDVPAFAERFLAHVQGAPNGNTKLLSFLNAQADLHEALKPYLILLKRSDEVAVIAPATRLQPPTLPPEEQIKSRRLRVGRRARRLFRRLPWRAALVIMLLVIVIPFSVVTVLASDSYARVRETLSSLQRVVSSVTDRSIADITQTDFDRLRTATRNFSSSLDYTRQQTTLLRRFARFYPDVEVQLQLLDSAIPVVSAANLTMDGLLPIVTYAGRVQKDGKLVSGLASSERLVDLLRVGQTPWRQAAIQLETAATALAKFDLSKADTTTLLQYQELMGYQSTLADLNAILQSSPQLLTSLLGLDSPKTYLILSMNNDELRPSGGYISTFGWVRVQNFRVLDYDYYPTSETSPTPPSEAFLSQVQPPAWWFRSRIPVMAAWSGSWYADFARTAEMAARYYAAGENPRAPVDGVIGIDLKGFELMLAGLGEIKVEGYERTVSAGNFRKEVYAVRAANTVQQKDFLAVIFREVMANWQSLPIEKSTAVLAGIVRGAQTKRLQIYLADPELNRAIEKLGWAGVQTPGNDDYLMVADANLGNKSNGSIVRDQTLQVALQPDGSAKNALLLSYDYSAERAKTDPAVAPQHYGNQRDYFNLMQVFLPKTAQDITYEDLPGTLSIDPQATMTVLATTIRVNFNAEERYRFKYTVPGLVTDYGTYKRYRLLLQKQAGTPGDGVTVQVTLPPNATVVSRTEIGQVDQYVLDSVVVEYRLTLDTDKVIEILYR